MHPSLLKAHGLIPFDPNDWVLKGPYHREFLLKHPKKGSFTLRLSQNEYAIFTHNARLGSIRAWDHPSDVMKNLQRALGVESVEKHHDLKSIIIECLIQKNENETWMALPKEDGIIVEKCNAHHKSTFIPRKWPQEWLTDLSYISHIGMICPANQPFHVHIPTTAHERMDSITRAQKCIQSFAKHDHI